MNIQEAKALIEKLNNTVYNDCFYILNNNDYEIYSSTFGKIHIVKKEAA